MYSIKLKSYGFINNKPLCALFRYLNTLFVAIMYTFVGALKNRQCLLIVKLSSRRVTTQYYRALTKLLEVEGYCKTMSSCLLYTSLETMGVRIVLEDFVSNLSKRDLTYLAWLMCKP